MSAFERETGNPAEGLSFDHAEFEDGSEELFCNSCQQTLHDTYFLVDTLQFKLHRQTPV